MSWFDSPASDTQIPHRARIWLYLVAISVMAFLILPTLIVIPMSFSASQYLEFPPRQWSLRWYENYFNSAAWMQATVTSIKAGVLTAVVATPLGTLAAYGLFVSRLRAAANRISAVRTSSTTPSALAAPQLKKISMSLAMRFATMITLPPPSSAGVT